MSTDISISTFNSSSSSRFVVLAEAIELLVVIVVHVVVIIIIVPVSFMPQKSGKFTELSYSSYGLWRKRGHSVHRRSRNWAKKKNDRII